LTLASLVQQVDSCIASKACLLVFMPLNKADRASINREN
jgi:hypothetical protein